MLQLWVHESQRVIGDRMWDPADQAWLTNAIDTRLGMFFSTSLEEVFGTNQPCPPFVSFLRPMENPPYEAVPEMATLKVGSLSVYAVTVI
jgi:hypothetical protein